MLRKSILFLSAAGMLAALPAIASSQFQRDADTGNQLVPGANGGYANVAPEGKLRHGVNVTAVKHLSAGRYVVKFNNDTSKCSAQGTIIGRGKKSLVPAYIVLGPNHSQNSILVATFLTTTLLPADFPFNLTVTCGA